MKTYASWIPLAATWTLVVTPAAAQEPRSLDLTVNDVGITSATRAASLDCASISAIVTWKKSRGSTPRSGRRTNTPDRFRGWRSGCR